MKKATVGNLFGGSDEVRVRRDGTVRVLRHEKAEAKQLNLLTGEPEFPRTLRNEATEALDRADEAKREALLERPHDGPRKGSRAEEE